jgi:hypothetical protein
MASDHSPGLSNRNLLTPPSTFGYKTAWFAVRSTNTMAVAQALQLQNTTPANWEYGVWHAVESDGMLFVTPPVDGWVLAVGTRLLFGADDNHSSQRMVEWSKQFGEAQFFASMRVSDAYV